MVRMVLTPRPLPWQGRGVHAATGRWEEGGVSLTPALSQGERGIIYRSDQLTT